MTRELSYLRLLETEAVFVMREVAAEFERPVLLFSGGKDSIVLLRLAEKAFRPAGFPFPILHVDTGHNFPEVIEFRDRRVAQLGERLIVASVQATIDSGRAVEETGLGAARHGRGGGAPGRGGGGGGGGAGGAAPPPADDAAARRAPRQGVRRRAGRPPPRRGARPGQGARVLVPRRHGPVGPQEPAARAV